MKKLFLFILVLTSVIVQAQPSLETLRNEYYKLNTDSAACARLYKKVSSSPVTDNLYTGYKGAITASMANHVTAKAEKIKLFNSGKKSLEQAIAADSSNTELRFLRFTIQTNCPKALGYNKQINNDKKFILSHLDSVQPPSLRSRMAGFLLESKSLSEEEKRKINARAKR